MGSSLAWIILSGIAMSAIALVGSITLLLGEAHWKRWVKPLVAFAAGALVGGALFHMLPGALNAGLTFLLGGLLAYVMARQLDLRWLIPFAAGNFLYIGASDLVPEVNRARTPRENLQHFAAFLSGLGGLYALAWMGA